MVRSKICGVTNLDDAEHAVEHGAWAIGLIFHKDSPRRVRIADAAAIGAALHRRAEVAGVFVNATLDRIARVADEAGLTLLQLHGDEGPSFCIEAARRTGCRVIKAMPVRGKSDLQALAVFRTDFHLLDGTAHDGRRGGTGEAFDWNVVSGRRSRVPLIVAGGLTAENVGEAIAATHPFAVDTASGTEASPGHKDPAKVEAFLAAVAAASPAVPSEAA